ncbi:hypothetical protein ACFL0P_06210 [Candidatus Omnitrophota bacterium]
MKKRLLELSPSELMRTRIITASLLTLISVVWFLMFIPIWTASGIVYVVYAVSGGIVWFIFGHKLTIWLEKKLQKNKISQ